MTNGPQSAATPHEKLPTGSFLAGRPTVILRSKQVWFLLVNFFRHHLGRPITGAVPVVLSITSHKHRLKGVFLTLASIASGTTRPQRVILWVDHQRDIDTLPRTLVILQRRGLEVRVGGPYRVHNKWYPAIEQGMLDGRPLVVADDDVFYPRRWLEQLWLAHQQDPTAIWGHRMHQMKISGGVIAPYGEWSPRHGTRPGPDVLLTGVGGVIFPPAFLRILSEEGTRFLELSPNQDDVWLTSRAIKHGFPRAQVGEKSLSPVTIPGTQGIALTRTNVVRNDSQIAAAFADIDIASIERSGSTD